MCDMEKMENDCTTWKMSLDDLECMKLMTPGKKRKSLSTAGLVVPTKKKICKDKSKICPQSTPSIQSLVTLAQVSTLKEKVCLPFWTKRSTDWSKRLLSCTKIACVDMESKFWNLSLKNLGQNSWFSVANQKLTTPENLPTTYLPLQQSLWRDIMGDDPQLIEEDEKNSLKAIKIRLFPTKEQEMTLKQWFGTARWTYNHCVQSYQAKTCKPNKKSLRQLYINNHNFKDNLDWVKNVPYDIRDEAMNDFLKALKATKAKKDLKTFSFKFRSKKDKTQSIAVLKKHWGHRSGIYSNVFNSNKMKAERVLPEKLDYDSRLIRTRLNEYYLCIPKLIELRGDNQAPDSSKHCTISLDPGVRTFMTGYDPDGSALEWGKNDFGRIFRLCYAYDNLQSKWSQKGVKHHQRYRMQVAGRRIYRKIRNLVDEVHKKLAKYLCDNYRKIILPVFETSNMVRRGNRKLRKKTARSMLTWSHYRFRLRLLSKCREYPWCEVILTEEPYTSKTCGNCGEINAKLGGKKLFKCRKCDYVADRDVNGARNILLRYLTLRGVSLTDSVGATPLL